MSKQIIAEKQVGEKTITRTFHKITWDLLGVDKGGFVEVKQGKKPKELADDKAKDKADDKAMGASVEPSKDAK